MIKKRKVMFCLCLILLAASMFLMGCEDMLASPTLPHYESYPDYFNYASREAVSAEEAAVNGVKPDPYIDDNPDYEVSYEKVTATTSYEDLCSFGVDNDILYPGALVDISNGANKPISLARAPINISANLETILGHDEKLFTTVEKPNTSTVRQGIREIVSKNIKEDTNLPFKISMSIEEVNAEKEFTSKLGFGLQVSKFGMSENFQYSNLHKQTNLVLIAKQEFYTVDTDFPVGGFRGFFDQSVANADINKAVSNGAIPAYVATVSYGRIIVLSIQSNFSKEEIINRLTLGWGQMSDTNTSVSSKKKLAVEFDSEISKLTNDSDTNINYFIYGGSNGGNQVESVQPHTSLLSEVLFNFNMSANVGLPISYKLRDFSGGLVKIQNANEYYLKNIVYHPKRLMDWSYLNQLLESGEIYKMDKLTLDFSPLVNYADLSKTDINANRTITVPSNLKTLILNGPNELTHDIIFQNFSINVNSREMTNPLTLKLKNISFCGNDAPAISVIGTTPLNLELGGKVDLIGAEGQDAIATANLNVLGSGDAFIEGGAGRPGATGGTAINVKDTLKLRFNGKLTVMGGCGGAGTAGEEGKLGSNGGIGKSGTNGYNGGNGGLGGNGGNAVYAKNIKIENGNFEFAGGAGGKGGNGGNGGQGGMGGTSTDTWNTYEKAGKGGNGGNGGKGNAGGNGGYGISLPSSSSVSMQGTVRIRGGNGGNGGDGGNGGQGGSGGSGCKAWGAVGYHDGGPGGDGGNGGIGAQAGNGGLGGSAVFAASNTEVVYKEDSVKIQVGQNGVGGNGGNGGLGGQGGRGGASDGSHWEGAGGNGGNGGRGGNGGVTYTTVISPGNIVFPDDLIDPVPEQTLLGKGGFGGLGGEGGLHGQSASQHRDDGVRGNEGSSGEEGEVL